MEDFSWYLPHHKYTMFKAWKILTITDPCKKCLVSACCTYDSICQEKHAIYKLVYPYNSIEEARFIYIISFGAIIISLMALTIVILKITTNLLS